MGLAQDESQRTRRKERSRRKATAQEAAKTGHQKTQEQLRTFVECRAVWAALTNIPQWAKAGAKQCTLLEQTPDTLQGTGRESAIPPSLQQVFKTAFKQCEALVWLPVIFASDDPAQSGWIRQAWYQAVMESGIERFPSHPGCATLPGGAEILERLLALFESKPTLPAVILVGMDSPLANAVQQTPDSMLSHAVTALLISRPGLTAPSDAQIAAARRHGADGLMVPFWERERMREQTHGAEASPMWGSMPLALQPEFLKNFPPIATLHRTGTIREPAPKQGALARQFHEAIQAALIRAGLCEPPPADANGGEEGAPPKPEEPVPLGLGWLVHDAEPDGLSALTSALYEFGSDLDPIKEIGNVMTEYGEVGEAHNVLLLAGALIRTAQLQKPVLIAKFDESKNIIIGLACPPKKTASTELPAPQRQKAA
jgi:transposase InsO family protein